MQKISKFFIIFILVCIISMVLTACWSNKEMDQLAIVKGLGIDFAKTKDRMKMSVQLIKPQIQSPNKDSSGQTLNVWTTSSTGYGIFDAGRNMIKQTGKKLFYGQNKIIIYGEEVAREGLLPYIDVLNRDPEFRRRTNIYIAIGEAEEILKVPHGLEPVPSIALTNIIENCETTGTIHCVDLLTITKDLLNEIKDPVTAVVEIRPDGDMEKPNQNSEKLFVDKAALFKKDKLVDFLNRKETRGLKWIIMPEKVRGVVILETPDEKNNNIAIEIISVQSELKPIFKNNIFSMTVIVEAEGNIAEVLAKQYKVNKEANIQQLNKRLAQVIRNEILSAINKGKRYKSDFLGFGESIYRDYPDKFNQIRDQWYEIYKDLPVKIVVSTNIKRLGRLEDSIEVHQ